MIYIEKLKIVNHTYPCSKVFDLNYEIVCGEVNLFVGNQGVGKSTILTLLQQNHKDLEITLSEITKSKGVESYYFDSEKNNPRLNDLTSYSKPNGESTGIGVGNAIASRFMSHGECLKKFTVDGLKIAKDSVIILDEPESGLSLTNQYLLIKAIKKAIKNNCQIFISTHCYPLIEAFDVISLEHHETMTGVDFINKIKKVLAY